MPASDGILTSQILRSKHTLTLRMSYDPRDKNKADLLQKTDL